MADYLIARLRDLAESLDGITDYPEFGEAADRIEALEGWKASAIGVLGDWERTWEAAGSPGPLGGSKAANTLARIEALTAELAEERAHADALAEALDSPIEFYAGDYNFTGEALDALEAHRARRTPKGEQNDG